MDVASTDGAIAAGVAAAMALLLLLCCWVRCSTNGVICCVYVTREARIRRSRGAHLLHGIHNGRVRFHAVSGCDLSTCETALTAVAGDGNQGKARQVIRTSEVESDDSGSSDSTDENFQAEEAAEGEKDNAEIEEYSRRHPPSRLRSKSVDCKTARTMFSTESSMATDGYEDEEWELIIDLSIDAELYLHAPWPSSLSNMSHTEPRVVRHRLSKRGVHSLDLLRLSLAAAWYDQHGNDATPAHWVLATLRAQQVVSKLGVSRSVAAAACEISGMVIRCTIHGAEQQRVVPGDSRLPLVIVHSRADFKLARAAAQLHVSHDPRRGAFVRNATYVRADGHPDGMAAGVIEKAQQVIGVPVTQTCTTDCLESSMSACDSTSFVV